MAVTFVEAPPGVALSAGFEDAPAQDRIQAEDKMGSKR